MDNRTTIKVSKEAKARFDKIHKKLQLKNHSVTLELIISYVDYRHSIKLK
jgi:predicted transcriptional regulator